MSDEDQRVLAIKVTAVVSMSGACVAVILRTYVCGWIVRGFGYDDGAMALSLISMAPWLALTDV